MCVMLKVFEKLYSVLFSWTNENIYITHYINIFIGPWKQGWILFIPQNPVFTKYDMWTFILTFSRWQWWSLWINFPKLTRCLEMSVPVSSTVPVCCITIDRNVMLCAVEHEQLRLRHKLLYAKCGQPCCLRVSPVLFTVLKISELMHVLKWT